MANNQNLREPWKKGESGNPNGMKPGTKHRSTIAKKWLEIDEKAKNPVTGTEEVLSQEDLLTLAQIKKAREGDVNAYKALMDSAYGTPNQKMNVEMDAEVDQKITVEIIRANKDK
jgi:hypothetical protein